MTVKGQKYLVQVCELPSLDFITQVKSQCGRAGTYNPSAKQGRKKGIARDDWLPAQL